MTTWTSTAYRPTSQDIGHCVLAHDTPCSRVDQMRPAPYRQQDAIHEGSHRADPQPRNTSRSGQIGEQRARYVTCMKRLWIACVTLTLLCYLSQRLAANAITPGLLGSGSV